MIAAKRIGVWVAAVSGVVLLALALVYAAWPALVGWAAPRYLASLGVSECEIDIERPGLLGITIPRFRFQRGAFTLALTGTVVGYDLASLVEGRLRAVEVATLELEVAASDEPAVFEIPPLWNLIPSDRVDVNALRIVTAEPSALFVGGAHFDSTRASLALTATSPLLTTPLELHVDLSRNGLIDVALAELAGSPLLRLRGSPEPAGRLSFAGDVDVAGAPLALFGALAGINDLVGRITGQLEGTAAWPLPSSPVLGDFELKMGLETKLAGDLVQLADVSLESVLSISVAAGSLALEVKPGASLHIGRVAFGDWSTSGYALEARDAFRLSIPAGATAVAFQAGRIDLIPPALASGPVAVEFEPADRLHFVGEGTVPWPLPVDPIGAMSMKGVIDGSLAATVTGSPVLGWGEWSGAIDVELTAGTLRLTLREVSVVAGALGELVEGARIPEFGVDLRAPVTVEAQLNSGAVSLRGDDIGWSLPEVEWLGQRLAFRRGQLVLQSLMWQQPALHLQAQVRTRAGTDALTVSFDTDADLAAATGRFAVGFEDSIERRLLATELGGWKGDYDLDAGAIALRAQGNWKRLDERSVLAGTAELRLTKVAGHFGDSTVTDVDVTLSIAMGEGGMTAGPGALSIAAIDVGVAIEALRADVSLTPTYLGIRNLEAKMLGGSVGVSVLDYPFDSGISAFDVGLNGVALAEILALEGEDITGHGVLDGTLPVRIDGADVTMTGGRIAARPPGGRIQYRGAVSSGAANMPGLNLALDALADFTYDQLEATGDYSADGQLALVVRLRGRNPAVEKGRPIQFNLDVSENIPALLQSLQLSDELTERVQQRFSQ